MSDPVDVILFPLKGLQISSSTSQINSQEDEILVVIGCKSYAFGFQFKGYIRGQKNEKSSLIFLRTILRRHLFPPFNLFSIVSRWDGSQTFKRGAGSTSETSS